MEQTQNRAQSGGAQSGGAQSGGAQSNGSRQSGIYPRGVDPRGMDPRGIYFGGLMLPETVATTHFLVVGTTGSGKTLTLRLMMSSVLPRILDRPDQRAVIFDVKQDMLSILGGLGLPSDRTYILNPFDRRCHAWDMARDVTGPDTALQMATIFIPEEEGQNRYFPDAARDLLTGVLNVFIELGAKAGEKSGVGENPSAGKKSSAGGRWGLSDVVQAMTNPQRLRHVLCQTAAGRDLIALHLEGGNTTRAVLSTARTKLAPFEPIAAMWRHAEKAGRSISLVEFLRSNAILVLGNNQAAQAPLRAINRVLFQRLTELVLDQDEDDRRRTWFFLDEARKLGRLDGLDDLMTNGRSKGACVVLGFQDIDGLRHVYGQEIAGELTSMCSNVGVLKVAGASTPKWASEVMGEREAWERSYGQSAGESRGGGNWGSSVQEGLRERKVFLPSQFRLIDLPSPTTGLGGVYYCACIGAPYEARIPGPEVGARLLPKSGETPNFWPWPDQSCKTLTPWDITDYERLGLPLLTHAGQDQAVELQAVEQHQVRQWAVEQGSGALRGLRHSRAAG